MTTPFNTTLDTAPASPGNKRASAVPKAISGAHFRLWMKRPVQWVTVRIPYQLLLCSGWWSTPGQLIAKELRLLTTGGADAGWSSFPETYRAETQRLGSGPCGELFLRSPVTATLARQQRQVPVLTSSPSSLGNIGLHHFPSVILPDDFLKKKKKLFIPFFLHHVIIFVLLVKFFSPSIFNGPRTEGTEEANGCLLRASTHLPHFHHMCDRHTPNLDCGSQPANEPHWTPQSPLVEKERKMWELSECTWPPRPDRSGCDVGGPRNWRGGPNFDSIHTARTTLRQYHCGLNVQLPLRNGATVVLSTINLTCLLEHCDSSAKSQPCSEPWEITVSTKSSVKTYFVANKPLSWTTTVSFRFTGPYPKAIVAATIYAPFCSSVRELPIYPFSSFHRQPRPR